MYSLYELSKNNYLECDKEYKLEYRYRNENIEIYIGKYI
jgi:hypothetical protein